MRLLRAVDIGRVILALILAVGLWVVVQNEQNPDRTQLAQFTIPVDVSSIPDGLTMVSEAPDVQLLLRAPENVWPRLKRESFTARVNASGAVGGRNELTVLVDVTDALVRSAEPRPDRVILRFEEVRERSVPVKVNQRGNVPFGYSAGATRMTPERVTVVGPDSLVQRVDSAVIDLPLDGVTVSVSGTFNPRLVDPRGTEVRGVRLSPAQVSVEIPVNQEVTFKQVGIRPVTTGRLSPGYYLLPLEIDPPSATVVGHPSVLSALTVLETEPINVSDISTSVVRRASLKLPTGISLLTPELTVLVTVRVQALNVTQTMRVLPTVERLPPELVLASPLPLLELDVSGPAPTLQALTARDFRVTLNLSELGPGRHLVQPKVALPQSFELERLEPKEVVVELRQVEIPVAQLP